MTQKACALLVSCFLLAAFEIVGYAQTPQTGHATTIVAKKAQAAAALARVYVDLNVASKEELAALPGVGET